MAENGEPEPGGDDALVLALASGATIDAAAERAGCSPRTVSRRLADAAFARQISTVRGHLFAAATGRLANAAAKAADKLEKLLESPQDHVAYAAAKSILELGAKLRDAAEIEQRIAQLETVTQQNDRLSQTSPQFAGNGY
ncbi:MAG TPA: hypothetical protein VMV10_08160 [Pirellulales bacterium]|nr:hypothetical protein [Pirellulales bacterium]